MTFNPIRRALRATAFLGAMGGVLAAGLAMTATTARAATITVSDVISSSAATVYTASVQKFDTALGTLNQVQIRYDISVGLSALFLNASTTPGTTTVGDNALELRGPSNSDIFDPNLPDGQLRYEEFGGDFAIAPAFAFPNGSIITSTTTVDLGFDYDATLRSDGFLGSGFLGFNTSLFAGTGNFDFDFTATLNGPVTFTGFQPAIPVFPPTVTGTVTVTYDFTEAVVADIPAPAAWPLLAAALAGAGLLRRRRKTQG